MEAEAVVDVGRAGVVQGLERVGADLELASLLDREPVETFQVWGDVCPAQQVEN